MICQFCCDEIFESNRTWNEHRRFYTDKAIKSCDFCSALYPFSTSSSSITSNKPLYRWSIQKAGRVRECNDYITVIFRPVSNETEPGATALPTKIFQLIQQNDIQMVRNLSSTTKSKESQNQIHAWIKECITNHPHCQNPQQSAESKLLFPKRLIDIGKQDRQVLVSTRTPEFEPGRYITLSHCWGTPYVAPVASNSNSDVHSSQSNSILNSKPAVAISMGFKLMSHNVAQRMDPKRGIKWDELPLNFQDAINVARSINVRYIWIDALCILQDGDELEHECQLMHSVYRRSFCTIAAANARDSMGGLFRSREPGQVVPGVVSSSNLSGTGVLGDTAWYVLRNDVWSTDLLGQILYTRGWVYQERMLSPRILHYSHREIFWDCAEMSASETFPHGLPNPIDFSAATDRHWRERLGLMQVYTSTVPYTGTADVSFEKFWKTSVAQYTASNLSYATDRLKAIWGVAKVVREELGEQYGQGFWKNRLHLQLAWQVIGMNGNSRNTITVEKRMELGPSWSWAWTNAPVKLQDRLEPFQEMEPRYARNHSGGELKLQLAEDRYGLKGVTEPVLISRRIAVRERLIPAILVEKCNVHSGDTQYFASLQTDDDDDFERGMGSPRIQVFPDTLSLKSEERSCHLLVLAAYKGPINGMFDGLGLILYKYSGSEPDGRSKAEYDSGQYNHYRRGGIFKFSEFNQAAYDRIDATDNSMENFWLV